LVDGFYWKALSGPARRSPVEEGTAGVCGNEEDRVV